MPALIVVAAFAVLAVVGVAVYLVRLRRALVAERAARRLMARIHAGDVAALTDDFAARLNAALGVNAVLSEADRILDAALVAAHNDPEGGPL